MKKSLFAILFFSCLIISCIPDDSDSGGDDGPITANIRFEVVTTRNSEAVITTTIDNETDTENVENLPFSLTYSQTEIEAGTYLRLTYLENGSYSVSEEGSSWTDYSAVLTIYINNSVAATETFDITEDNSGVKQIDLTIN
ncbi:hypothetical protein [Psychroserpens sp. SPM9]|uniref:hypothetical protein n=1 Tax=Psychroserpens sp. SPM9 TaxID=2975598 RepID=UPI0021A30738|nr:hypothetical protein [Psychroserpens sp. SPM9]MDG5492495.1 hypothetical protein [Psychroserpens sp. SPM9]